MRKLFLAAVIYAALLGVLPGEVGAQTGSVYAADVNDNRRYLDYYVSRYRLGWDSDRPAETDAVGGRLMWSVAPLLRTIENPWLDRTLVGGYITHTPEDADHNEILRYGAQIDFIVTSTPFAGRVEPLVSLAAGAVRVTEAGVRWRSVPYIMPDEPEGRWVGRAPLLQTSLPDRTWTGASITPGIGARIRLMRGVSFRTDARQVIDFYDRATNNFELSGGISVGTE